MIRLAAAVAIGVSLVSTSARSQSVAPVTSASTKIVALPDFSTTSGTALLQAATYLGSSCGGAGCVVAKASSGANLAVAIHLGGAKLPASELRTGLLISHDVAHSLDVALNGVDILSLQCNGVHSLTVIPRFSGLGAQTSAFTWELLDGGKVIKAGSGTAAGDGITIDLMSSGGAMQLVVSNTGVMSIEHGTQRLVLTPDAKSGIGAKTGGAVRFEDLGLRVAGPQEFAVMNTVLK
jgi:hypothetical protein